MKLTVIVPAYNEVATIEEIIRRVRAVPVDKEIILIDDGSTDGTREWIAALEGGEVRCFFHDRNMGKGSCVQEGIAAARGEYIIVQDADLEYDPADYPALLAAAEEPGVYAVFGSRVLGMRREGVGFPLSLFSLGRRVTNLIFHILYASPLTDIHTCYKLARREVLQSLRLRSKGFDLDMELAGKLVRGARARGERVVEVPIRYRPRSVAEGKKIRWWDGIAALWAILRFRFVN